MGTTAQKLEYLQGTKDALKTQLTAKGVTVSANTTFRQMANLVGEIGPGTSTVTLYSAKADTTAHYIGDNGSLQEEMVFAGNRVTLECYTNSLICLDSGSLKIVSGDASIVSSYSRVAYVFGDCELSW